MGAVYEALQISLDRRVAVKLILSGEFASELEIARFNEEVDALACLDHPNIVPIYSVGEQAGRCFYTMKLLEGGSLEDHLASFVGSPKRAASLMCQIARAVHSAHQAGILHRDLKAANILFDGNGNPYVTDFGLARFISSNRGYTATQVIQGTPEYLSPERIAGIKTLTTAIDVWSLGVLFYRLLGGTMPFTGESLPQLLRAITDREPAPLPNRVDTDLVTICHKCLEKEPAKRYASASAVADDLERWMACRPISARRTRPMEACAKWIRRRPWQALSLGAVGAALLGPPLVACWFILTLNKSRGHHPLVPLEGLTNDLPVRVESASRITSNIAGETFDSLLHRRVRIEFIGVPDSLKLRLKVRFRADWAVLEDPIRSPILGHGDIAVVEANIRREILEDTFLYLEPVGWTANDVLKDHPAAAVRIILDPVP